jgi:hypothetical protein
MFFFPFVFKAYAAIRTAIQTKIAQPVMKTVDHAVSVGREVEGRGNGARIDGGEKEVMEKEGE